MVSQPSAVVQQLRQQIYYALDNDLLQNALFLAGRYHGLDSRNADAAHLLALCELKMGHLQAAYDCSRDSALKPKPHLGCAYIFAQACLGLEVYADGITALERSRGLWAARNHWNKHSHLQRQHLPDAAVVSCLLGKLWRAYAKPEKAIEYFVDALKLNPFLWDAFLQLCELGVSLQTSDVFRLTPDMLASVQSMSALAVPVESLSQHLPQQTQDPRSQYTTPGNDPFNPTVRTAGDPGLNHGGSNLLSRLNGSFKESKAQTPHWETPTGNGSRYDEDVMMRDLHNGHHGEAPQAPLRKTRNFLQEEESEFARPIITRSRTKAGSEGTDDVRSSIPVTQKRTVSGHAPTGTTNAVSDPATAPARRSNRLLNSIRPPSSRLGTSSKEQDGKESRELRKPKPPSIRSARNTSTVGRVVSGNRKPPGPEERNLKESARPASAASFVSTKEPVVRRAAAPLEEEPNVEHDALQWLLDLLAKLGEGYYRLTKYQSQSAISIFQTVPPQQRDTPWVLSQIGKAYYERAAYGDAQKAFQRVRRIAPSRMQDMEIYSTVLWQLKDDVTLGHLSYELLERDHLSPEAWCAMGNSFSLQREHDQAVKCFRRATQLDPKFAYAFTLQGHEHVANEEFDKALYAYRCAISANNRHYNGWYGLGQVFEKLQKHDLAEKHYRCAHEINSTNPVLAVCIGVVLDKVGKYQSALIYYSQAASLDPSSAKARFMRARALMKLKHYDEARAELEKLKTLAPNEATVHFMLGKLHKVMGEKTAAIHCLTSALNLDPKSAPHIKEALESLEDDEWEDDDVD